ncbi:MAG: RNA polymerase sigma factor [Planctomycetaceae bacterium]|nr:RNA polymerase sigma factor [Planctomycetaceae bacterium]
MSDSESLQSELQVVQGCLSGDGESLRLFISRFRSSVYGLCYRILRHHEDAEDVVQDTFLRAIRSLHQWDQQRPLKPWLLTIAANRCRTALAKRSRSVVHYKQEVTDLAVSKVAPAETSCDLAGELEHCLQKLKPNLRECFLLFYREQLSCAEVAERMQCPEGTIKTWLHRARHQLSSILKQRGVS